MASCAIIALLLLAAADPNPRGAGLEVEKRRELLESMSIVGRDNESKHGDLWSVSSATTYDHTCRQDVVQFQAAGTGFDTDGAGANGTGALTSALAAQLDAALGAWGCGATQVIVRTVDRPRALPCRLGRGLLAPERPYI